MRRQIANNKWHFLWLILLLIVFLPIVLILVPFIILSDRKWKKEAKAFWLENLNKFYFFYSNKNGWGDFIANNIIPVLPKDTILVNIYKDEANLMRKVNSLIDREQYPWSHTRLPILVRFNEGALWVHSFYFDYKSIVNESVKTDNSIQNSIEAQILAKLNSL